MTLLLFFKKLFLVYVRIPAFLMYFTYDKLIYYYTKSNRKFYGWGIHLYTGRFGAGKTSAMVQRAYNLAKKYPQLTILTNMKLTNFPSATRIVELKTAHDILNSNVNTLVLIDEIGTIFNSRDFNSGKTAVPKVLFQHLCQCRHRKMMILATVQRFNLLDKQIRDITADVTYCTSYFAHPFTRLLFCTTYDIDEFETAQANRLYTPVPNLLSCYIQKDRDRQLYDTEELIESMLHKDYLDDKEILENRQEVQSSYSYVDKSAKRSYHKRNKYLG